MVWVIEVPQYDEVRDGNRAVVMDNLSHVQEVSGVVGVAVYIDDEVGS